MTRLVSRPRIGLFVLLLLLLVGYALPWVVGAGAGLTFSGYDLAEWTSLHPAVRGVEPVLLTTLLLRLPLTCIALWIAFAAPSWWRWLTGAAVVLLALAQLPPFEFVTVARIDPNYRQQALLAGITLVVGLGGVFTSPRPGSWGRWVAVGAALMGAAVGILGLIQALDLMRAFDIPASPGIGAVATPVLFVVSAAITGRKQKE